MIDISNLLFLYVQPLVDFLRSDLSLKYCCIYYFVCWELFYSHIINCSHVYFLVGYTMRDIRYKWNEGFSSVGVSNEVSLPQFRVLGHRQRAMEISLSTGNLLRQFTKFLSTHNIVHYKLLLVKFSISGIGSTVTE